MKIKRLGLIGVGGIMNSTHLDGYLRCSDCRVTAIADISPDALKRTGDRLNLPEAYRFDDYRKLLKCGMIDAVDIATSNDAHVEIAIAALEAGFPVSIEKPIGMNFAESAALARKSTETGLPVFVCFSLRYDALIYYMKTLIDEGCLGKLYHIFIRYGKDSGLWPGRRLEWRFQENRASSGVLCDLGSHMFDMIRFFGEEFDGISCSRGTIVKRRQLENSEDWGDVTTDDWSNAVCRLKSGIDATVTLSRCITNEICSEEFYLIGEKGSLRFVGNDTGRHLYLCTGGDCKTNTFREVTPPESLTVSGQSRAYLNLLDGRPDAYSAQIYEGMRSQAAVDAAKLSSQLGRVVTIKELYESVGMTV